MSNRKYADGSDSGRKVYVGPHLDTETTVDEIRNLFVQYGPIRAVWVARSPPGFAYVTFEDPRDASHACRGVDGTEFLGQKLRVELARGPRQDRFRFYDERGRSYSPRRISYHRRSPSYEGGRSYSYRSHSPSRRARKEHDNSSIDRSRSRSRERHQNHSRQRSRSCDRYKSRSQARHLRDSHNDTRDKRSNSEHRNSGRREMTRDKYTLSREGGKDVHKTKRGRSKASRSISPSQCSPAISDRS